MRTDTGFNVSHVEQAGVAFDKFLPYIQPVTDAMLAHLPALGAGAVVLDLACGTGEPGLSLVRREPEVRLLGIDASDGMLAVARRKADAERLGKARFEAMPLDALTLGDASVSAVLSRFGFLLFGDPAASASELARVLKPEGAFSFAVWEETAANTFLSVTLATLGSQIEPERLPRFDQFDALAVAGRRERWLRDAGVRQVESEPFRWNYDVPDVETAWDFVAGPGMFANLVADLDETRRAAMRQDFADRLAPYRGAEGRYSLPHTCRVFWGSR